MRRRFAQLVMRLAGWKSVGTVPRSGVLVGAPHTSNWDFVMMLLIMWGGGVTPRVLIKQEFFAGPLGPIIRALGGIELDRDNPRPVVDRLLREAGDGKPFLLILAAEGARAKGTYWKSGFWRIAKAAGVPISLAFIDGPSRTSGFGLTFEPSDDVRADMDKVRAFYAGKRGLRPERRTEPRLREEDQITE